MKLNYLTFGLVVLLGISSCSKDEDHAPDPITKANIIGSVNLYDEGVTKIDNSNMTVSVEGISPTISVKTDANGRFTLSDVKFGTYTLIYEKSGFGTFKRFDLEHTNTGNSTIITSAPSLGKISTTKITDLKTTVNGNDVLLSVTTNPAGSIGVGNTRYLRYFLSTASNVSNENYIYFSPVLISQINPKEITLLSSTLSAAGFSKGETVFIKVYGDSFWSNTYYDTNLGRDIFPNLNMTSANSVSFIMP